MQNMPWVKAWSGKWSLLTCTYLGEQHSLTIKPAIGKCFPHVILIIHNGRSTCYYRKNELGEFEKHLLKKVKRDSRFIRKMCDSLVREADNILPIIMKLKGRGIGKAQHGDFRKALYSYVGPHVAVKRLPDSLPPGMLEQNLPELERARVHSEPVYKEVEEYMEGLGMQLGREKGIPSNLALCMTKDELEKYFMGGKMPPISEVKARDGSTALIFVDGKYGLVAGEIAEKIEEALHGQTEISELRGTCAYPGKAVGMARIILDPKRAGNFKKGDILVASMTRPEYIHLMKLAGAVVTDAGGMLSHAAITARELKIPTIVGTEKGTKVFKEGEILEVDATKGIVRKFP